MGTMRNTGGGLAKITAVAVSLVMIFAGVPGMAQAQVTSLKDVPAPEPANLSAFVKDKQAAIALGKALFWDMQVGSDSVQACATCHSKAGADNRTKNQLNPGLNDNDVNFGNSGLVAIPGAPTVEDHAPPFAPNYQVKAGDFPFHSRNPETQGVPRSTTPTTTTPAQEFASVVKDTNDVMSSQGVRLTNFLGVVPGFPLDIGRPLADPVFNLSNFIGKDRNLRRVEPRNTPTMINAVFNADNFWDGRASMVFNGVNPFGFRDRSSTLKQNIDGKLTDVLVRIPKGSLASQAVGPPVSNFEMAFQGRDFPSIGRKMLKLRPLALQLVHPQDSVLGAQSRAVLVTGAVAGLRGLKVANYAEMIKQAFKDEWWNSQDICSIQDGTQFTHMPEKQNPRTFKVNLGKALIRAFRSGMALGDKDFTQMEYNFSLFFGLAVQLYEATLVADDTPWDRFVGSPVNVRGYVRGTEVYPPGTAVPKDPSALTPQEVKGSILFGRVPGAITPGGEIIPALGCAVCHTTPEFTEHTVRNLNINDFGVPSAPQRLLTIIGDGNGGGTGPSAYIDFGMRNLGHRPSSEDIGRAGTAPSLPPFLNPWDNDNPLPLSYVEMAKLKVTPSPSKPGEPTSLPPDVAFYVPDLTTARNLAGSTPIGNLSITKGNFKVPGLRLGMLTGPYFHDGGYSTLRQVVQFYARGGNFPNTNYTELAGGIVPIKEIDPSQGTVDEKAAAEANIQALVAFLARGLTDERVLYQQAPFDHPQLFIPNGALNNAPLIDQFIEVPPVGKNGSSTKLPTFLGLNPQTP